MNSTLTGTTSTAVPGAETRPRAGSADLRTRLDTGLERAADHLSAMQHPEGFWWAPLEANATMNAEYLLLTHFLGIGEKTRWTQVANHLLAGQNEDGGWSVYAGGPSDLNATIESYVALKLAGIPPEDPRMKRARHLAVAKGGIPGTRVFTRVWLALVGEYDWDLLPSLPPELVLLPSWFPFNIYAFACWARQTIVPMTVLFALRPVRPLPAHAKVPELYPTHTLGRDAQKASAWDALSRLLEVRPSWRAAFRQLDRALKVYERRPLTYLRGRALEAAAEWIVERQERDGSWGGIQPPWVYSLMALSVLGYENDHPVIERGIAGLENFGVVEGDRWWMQSCISPVWDTGLAVLALRDAGRSPNHPDLVKAAEWLLDRQIRAGGDWQVMARDVPPGGWAFEFDNDNYPDTDDTAVVLMALRRVRVRDEAARRKALEDGFRWLVGMQSENGGWGAFDKNNTRRFVAEIPFCDFGEVIDPPSEDVTAHSVECLARFGYDPAFGPTARGLDYLRATQEPDGSWFGRWGVNYVYGTGAVLPAFAAAGEAEAPEAQRGADWLEAVQNPDGGWGESCASYDGPAHKARGESTPSQTAWALLGLLAVGRGRSEAVRRGIEWLLDHQDAEGGWPERAFTGTGFPRDFMLRYHIYRDVFPTMALGRYRAQAT